MINNITLIGRIANDPELRQAGENVTMTVNLANDRDYKDKDGSYPTDFIPCTLWNAQADYLYNYAHKGDMIAVHGRVQVDSWTKDDKPQYKTYVLVRGVNIISSKRTEDQETTKKPTYKKRK